MDEERIEEELPEEPQEEPREEYKPRPWWQVAMAWILLILVIVGVISYYYWLARKY